MVSFVVNKLFCLVSWKFWALILIVLFILLYLIFGGNRDYEVVGLQPLLLTQHNDTFSPQPSTQPELGHTSIGEQLTRKAFETLLGRKVLYNYRPDFLKNPITGRNLELDCYDKVLKIAVEYNGEQHYHFPNRFHKTEEEFQLQQQRDELKKQLCTQNGIFLICIPYSIDSKCDSNQRYQRIYNFLSRHLNTLFLKEV